MKLLLDQLEQGARVLIVRIRSMGDCVLTTPALQLLAAHRPDLRIGVVVEDRFAEIYSGLPFVQEILPPLAAAARRFGPQLCVNLHGGSRSTVISATCGARYRAGFGHYRNQFVYNVKLPRAQEVLGEERTVHTAEHVASAMFYLGVPQAQPIPRAMLSAAAEPPRSGYYAVVHPFASSTDKTWPAANFVAAAQAIREQHGLEPVILAGPGDDVSPFEGFEVWAAKPLADVKTLIRHASYFLGNDSGPAHIAAAFDIPLTVVFGPSNPEIWGPWRASKARILKASEPVSPELAVAAL